jgi:predicted nucleotidyltransferase
VDADAPPLREPTVAALGEYFAAEGAGIVAAYLFGSVARASATVASDVDVAVPFGNADGSDPLATFAVEGAVERLLRRRVQVVDLERGAPDLVHRVLRDGILVHEADRSARIRFEIAARNRYFDLQPVLARYRRRERARP